MIFHCILNQTKKIQILDSQNYSKEQVNSMIELILHNHMSNLLSE